MNGEVLKAKALTLSGWAEEFRNDSRSGSTEVAFLLSRAARAMVAIADGEPVPDEPVPVKDPPMDEARPG